MYMRIKKGILFLFLTAALGIILSLLFVAILSFFLLQQEIPVPVLKILLTITTILSGFIIGLVMGKKMKEKKYIWGFFTGLLYFVLLLVIKFFFGNAVDISPMSIMPLFFCCIGSSTMGGMLG